MEILLKMLWTFVKLLILSKFEPKYTYKMFGKDLQKVFS